MTAAGWEGTAPSARGGGRVAELSVVVPCRNVARELPSLLASLAAQEASFPWEVIVADNGSTDRTRDAARAFGDRLSLEVVDAGERAGPAYARNVGAAVANARALVFLDADDEVAPGFVVAMRDALREHEVVAPRADRTTLNAGSGVTWRDWRFQHDRLPDTYGFLPFALGSGLGVTRRAFQSVSGFDPALPTGEDVDLSWRLQLAGFAIHLEPGAVVRHRFRRGLAEQYRQARGYGVGQAALYRKFGRQGMPRRGPRETLRDWVWLVTRIPRRPTWSNWAFWLNMLGYRVGRLQGSLRYRVLYL